MIAKPNALVYFRRNDLIVAGKRVAPAKLSIDKELVDNLEVRNPEKFIATCQAFFSSHDLAGKRVLVVLDSSVVFFKALETDNGKKGSAAQAAEDFVAAMPFEPGVRACLEIIDDDRPELYAANADLYGTLQEALRLSDVKKIIALTPVGAYRLERGIKPAAAIERYMSDKNVYRTADFSTVTPV
jgi:hypothetical protein